MISLQNINDRINLRGMMSQFADIMIERFEKSLRKNRVGNSKTARGYLIRSFRKAMFYSGNDMPKATITFLAYGRMPDMGVGRGTNITEHLYIRSVRRYTGERVRRRKKPWYSKTKAGQIKKFRELLIKQFGEELVKEAEAQITQTMTLNNLL